MTFPHRGQLDVFQLSLTLPSTFDEFVDRATETLVAVQKTPARRKQVIVRPLVPETIAAMFAHRTKMVSVVHILLERIEGVGSAVNLFADHVDLATVRKAEDRAIEVACESFAFRQAAADHFLCEAAARMLVRIGLTYESAVMETLARTDRGKEFPKLSSIFRAGRRVMCNMPDEFLPILTGFAVAILEGEVIVAACQERYGTDPRDQISKRAGELEKRFATGAIRREMAEEANALLAPFRQDYAKWIASSLVLGVVRSEVIIREARRCLFGSCEHPFEGDDSGQ